MHRAVILADNGFVHDVPMGILSDTVEPVADTPEQSREADFDGGLKQARAICLAQFERHYLRWLLSRTRGNVSEAARRAGTERRHLGRMIKRTGLSPSMFRP